jgi:hypothetical protein
MVTVLCIPIKRRGVAWDGLDVLHRTKGEVLDEMIRRVLQPFTCIQHPSTNSGYYNVLCADGNFRRCIPHLSAGLPDCPDYSYLHHLKREVCFCCEGHLNELGDHHHSDK